MLVLGVLLLFVVNLGHDALVGGDRSLVFEKRVHHFERDALGLWQKEDHIKDLVSCVRRHSCSVGKPAYCGDLHESLKKIDISIDSHSNDGHRLTKKRYTPLPDLWTGKLCRSQQLPSTTHRPICANIVGVDREITKFHSQFEAAAVVEDTRRTDPGKDSELTTHGVPFQP